MISQIKQKGFTIVELLIVIVVIAILAAISIAAYSNITARANTSTAVAAAKSVRDVAATFNSAHAMWPANKAAFVNGVPATGGDPAGAVSKLPADVTFAASVSATQSTGPKTVIVRPHVTGGNTVGFTVTHWDYSANAAVETKIGETPGTAGTAYAN